MIGHWCCRLGSNLMFTLPPFNCMMVWDDSLHATFSIRDIVWLKNSESKSSTSTGSCFSDPCGPMVGPSSASNFHHSVSLQACSSSMSSSSSRSLPGSQHQKESMEQISGVEHEGGGHLSMNQWGVWNQIGLIDILQSQVSISECTSGYVGLLQFGPPN